jgi:hypothetical protein
MKRYKVMVKRLREVLTKEEFLELQELLDNGSAILSELISAETAKMAPELFVTEKEKI